MSKQIFALLMLMLLAVTGWSQETPAPETPEQAVESPAADAAAGDGEDEPDDVDSEDSDLDSQTYEEDDDDFVPTEEIPADEPIPFPSNI